MKRKAIISVYNKDGLEAFARGLSELGIEILSTGGTAKFLGERGIALQSIDEYTGHPEILEGRVKSLHPKIHGGILARRDRETDLLELSQEGISPIDLVVVNLYPFTEKVREIESTGQIEHGSLIELIDIGGPTMIRAAAKNWKFVIPVCDPADYAAVLEELRSEHGVSLELRRHLAGKVFTTMAVYDGAIARYFSLSERLLTDAGKREQLSPIQPIVLEQTMSLRYGENPHQQAGLYRTADRGNISAKKGMSADTQGGDWEVLQGKELSYNNLLDMYAALDLFLEIHSTTKVGVPAVIIKHSNPCGAAIGNTPVEAFRSARDCDPVSAFGGIVVVGGTADAELASAITEGFVEVVVVESLDSAAAAIFAKKKNIRLIRCNFAHYIELRAKGGITVRNFLGDFLVQTIDNQLTEPADGKVVSIVPGDPQAIAELSLAWKICKHVKSNAIVIVKNGRAIGVGAGQMSRVDAARIAIERARSHGHDLQGAVAASDAFLPFSDTLEVLNDAGITALVQPGGSIKDEDVLKAANDRKMLMVVTGERHFRH